MNRLIAIVPVFNGGDEIALCVQALSDAGLDGDAIIIVDDGSNDGAARLAADTFRVRYLFLADGPNGPAHARNEGAWMATEADTLLFVDADVIVQHDTVAGFLELLEEQLFTAAAFGSYDDDPPAPGWISQYKNLLHHYMHQTSAVEASTFWSGCGVVRRDAFLAVGGFDERFLKASIEDIDLGLRLIDAGYHIRLCREIQCCHQKRWSLAGWLKTDIFARALPWSRLIVRRGKGIPDTLNLGWSERCSALLALTFFVALLLMFSDSARPSALALMLASAAGFLILQRGLLTFFKRRRGVLFALVASLMHAVYFIYSSVTFILVRLASWRYRAIPGAS